MPHKLNHVLFSSGGRELSPLFKRVLIGAIALTIGIIVAVNWDALTQTSANRYRAAYEGRRFDEAIQIAGGMIDENPGSSTGYRFLAAAHIQKALLRQDFDASVAEALANAREAVRLDSANTENRRVLAFAFEIVGNLDEAAAQYQSILDIDPQNATVMAQLAAVYEKQRKVVIAEDLFQRALLADTENDQVRVLYARYMLQSGSPERAIELVRGATDSEKIIYLAEANRVLSAALIQIGEIDDAVAPAELAFSLAPDSALVVQNYGDLLMRQLTGPYEMPFTETVAQVRELADRATNLDPTLATPAFLAFRAAYIQKDAAAADEYAKKTIRLLPNDQTLSPAAREAMRQFILTVPTINARLK